MNLFQDITFSVQLKHVTFCHYQLTIGKKQMRLTFPQLLQLRNQINELTTFDALESIINNDNYVLLFVADRKHLLFLEIPTLLEVKAELSLCFDSY